MYYKYMKSVEKIKQNKEATIVLPDCPKSQKKYKSGIYETETYSLSCVCFIHIFVTMNEALIISVRQCKKAEKHNK